MNKIEKHKILSVFSNGKKMLSYYEAIGMKNLRDFKDADVIGGGVGEAPIGATATRKNK